MNLRWPTYSDLPRTTLVLKLKILGSGGKPEWLVTLGSLILSGLPNFNTPVLSTSLMLRYCAFSRHSRIWENTFLNTSLWVKNKSTIFLASFAAPIFIWGIEKAWHLLDISMTHLLPSGWAKIFSELHPGRKCFLVAYVWGAFMPSLWRFPLLAGQRVGSSINKSYREVQDTGECALFVILNSSVDFIIWLTGWILS